MRRCLIHDDHQMTMRMVPQHLVQKFDDFLGRDAFVEKAKQQLTALANRRRRRDAGALSSHFSFRRLSARSPSLAQKRRPRNIRFVLKIQAGTVFSDGLANLRNFVRQPFLSRRLVQFVLFSLRLLVGQARVAKTSPNRILGKLDVKLIPNDSAKSSDRPQVGFETERHGARQNDREQFTFRQLRQLARTTASRSPMQGLATMVAELGHPSRNRFSIHAKSRRHARDGHPCDNRKGCSLTNLRCKMRSFAHGRDSSSRRHFSTTPMGHFL